MYMNNPLSGEMPVLTCSNKLRTYTTARYYTEDEILNKICLLYTSYFGGSYDKTHCKRHRRHAAALR